MVAINIDTRDLDKPKNWLKEAGIDRLTYYTDPDAKMFQELKVAGRATGMPTTLLVDAAGCEIGTLAGPAEWASNDAVKLVPAALASSTVVATGVPTATSLALDPIACVHTLNQMVYLSHPSLDRTFAALADPTRRALLAQLGESEQVSVSELAQPFTISLPAVMKHLDVLSDAGLMTRAKSGRTVTCRLNAAAMEAAAGWLNRYARFWNREARPACRISRGGRPM